MNKIVLSFSYIIRSSRSNCCFNRQLRNISSNAVEEAFLKIIVTKTTSKKLLSMIVKNKEKRKIKIKFLKMRIVHPGPVPNGPYLREYIIN